VSRSTALARLAAAYGAHQIRRLRRRGRAVASGEAVVLETYQADRLFPLTPAERELLPAASRCISCGLCAVVVKRIAGLRPDELASAYLRDYPGLGSVAGEVGTGTVTAEDESLLKEAADACPVGVPLPGVLEMVRRLASA
jgi:ferredoxin